MDRLEEKVDSAGKLMAIIAILLTVSLSTMFAGLSMGAGYKANMEAYYPYDAGVALDAPLTKKIHGANDRIYQTAMQGRR